MIFTTLGSMARYIEKHHQTFCYDNKKHVMENCAKIKNYLNEETAAIAVSVPATVWIEDTKTVLKTEISIAKYDRTLKHGCGWVLTEKVVGYLGE